MASLLGVSGFNWERNAFALQISQVRWYRTIQRLGTRQIISS